jgi:uridine kinase
MIRTAAFDVRADRAVDAAWQRVGDDIVLLFDGIFLLRPELRDHFDFTIFLHVDFSVSVARAVERDRQLGSPKDVLRRYQTRYVPGQRLYLSEARPQDRADVVVDNNDYDKPVILRPPSTPESLP